MAWRQLMKMKHTLVIVFNEEVKYVYQQLQLLMDDAKHQEDTNHDAVDTQETEQKAQAKVTTPILVKAFNRWSSYFT